MFQTRYKANRILTKADQTKSRISVLIVFAIALFIIIMMRLFQLQIIRHDVYSAKAEEQHVGRVELPAKRGDIYVKDTNSEELSKVATNTTLDLLYVDPFVAEDKPKIAEVLTPLIFPREEYEACKEAPKECYHDITVGNQITEQNEDEGTPLEDEKDEEEEDYEFKDYDEVLEEIRAKIAQDISREKIDFVPLERDASDALMEEISKENLTGIFVNEDSFMIYADPTLIPKKEFKNTVKVLSEKLEKPVADLEFSLSVRDLRYVALKNKLSPEISVKIKDIIKKEELDGVVLIPEHWRFYPEGQLASNIIGYLDRNNSGQYGIEGYFNAELEGKKGSITSESDPNGRQITVGETEIINAVDGDSIVLTIDRVIQKKVEEVLKNGVEEFNADSGQVIVMDPFTGAVVAMANYPTFDPNDYAEALKLRKFDPDEDMEAYKRMEIFKKDKRGKYIPINKQEGDLENNKIQKYVYVNGLGLGALKNKTVNEYYEPGSTFKPLVMAIGLDVGEVTPNTTFYNTNVVEIDATRDIGNSVKWPIGTTSMRKVLENSMNTGMAFVAEKLGAKLMYDYLKNFGFGEYSKINLEGEVKPELEYYNDWERHDLITRSYGQGIVVTPLQLITAWSALANGGKLMQPYIVDSVIKEGGETIKTEPKILNRVISEETSSIITTMLISVVKSYNQQIFKIPGYEIAGKTGTAQIAGPGGYEREVDGSTITSFVGYAPASKPKFVVLIKLDRPRIGTNTWGETTAGPIFKEIAEFMLDYYNIQPE